MKFILIQKGGKIPYWAKGQGETAYLLIDYWNDFSYVTMFYLSLHDAEGNYHELGSVKIGFKGQTTKLATYEKLNIDFSDLGPEFFSLGTDVEYYLKCMVLQEELRCKLLIALRDIAFSPFLIDAIEDEQVVKTSFLRGVSLSVIKNQYFRVLQGYPPLTDFSFVYKRFEQDKIGSIELSFDVKADAMPSNNVYALIGRNGVGKTTILNGMTEAVVNRGRTASLFLENKKWAVNLISEDYFSSVVSIAFSAFDPFEPPVEQGDPTKGTCYFYIGLKNSGNDRSFKDIKELYEDFSISLDLCLSEKKRKERWEKAIQTLESDENFANMQLLDLAGKNKNEIIGRTKLMSSGHVIVLLSITKLVARVEEKTLVLIDEPESHLHPPLLSAFIRSLSELLHNRNGVAVIATHSPVVLQEIPKCCVWKINRSRLETSFSKPQAETFGENVGILTREVFGLEVVKSGFHKILKDSVTKGGSYDDILQEYNHQLGFEAKAILKAMIINRDS